MLLWNVIAGCESDKPQVVDSTAPDTEIPTTDTTPWPDTGTDTGTDTGAVERDCAQARMGPAGGAITYYDVRVDLPEGALAGDIDVTLCVADPPSGVVPASDVMELGPPDLALLVAATVTIDHTGDPETTGLFVPDPAGAPVRQVLATNDEQRITGPLYRPGLVYAAEDDRALVPYLSGGVMDLLFVVDNSCSMADEQAQLGANMEVVLQALLGTAIDFHLGVVTTDIDSVATAGELREANGVKWVEATTPTPGQVFTSMANAGTTGSGLEKGLGAAYVAIEEKGSTENAGFLRPDARLAVVIVSDEPDATPASVITDADFVTWFDDLKANPEASWFHSIVDPTFGVTYANTSAATGGLVEDVTSNDWTVFLSEVVDLAGTLGPVVLPSAPVGPVEAWVAPADGAEPYRLDPALVTVDPLTNTVVVEPTAIPADAAVWLLYLPA